MKEDELVKRARDEVLAELFLRKQQRRKDYNRNVLSVRTNDTLASKIKDH